MADKNSQRILSLVLCLTETKVPLLREQIKERVEWYRELSEQNFLATFERDKAMIRDWGIDVEAPSDGAEFRYQISQDSLTLPPLTFTEHEASLIAAAAQVWEHTKLIGESELALAKLHAAGVPVENPSVISSELPGHSETIDVLLTALTERQAVKFILGDTPERIVEPWYLQFRTGQWYLFGWDRGKNESRAYLVSRIKGLPKIVASQQQIAPPKEDYEAMMEKAFPNTGDRIAKIAIRKGTVTDLRRKGTPRPEEIVQSLGDDFEVWEVPYASDGYHKERFLRAIAGEGSDVIVLEPYELRNQVIVMLESVLSHG